MRQVHYLRACQRWSSTARYSGIHLLLCLEGDSHIWQNWLAAHQAHTDQPSLIPLWSLQSVNIRKGLQYWMQLLLPHTPQKSSSLAELFGVHFLWKIQSNVFLSSCTWCSKAYFVLLYSVLIWSHKDIVYSVQMRNNCSPSYCFEFPDSWTHKNLSIFYLTIFFFPFHSFRAQILE